MIETIFFIAAFIALVSALFTISAHNVVHALLYLVVMMLAIALIFFLLGAPFAAALQIIVYAGAIMVLFIFVTMMLHQGEKSLEREHQLFEFPKAWKAFLFSAILCIEFLVILANFGPAPLSANPAALLSHTVTVKQLGQQLYGPYQLLVIISALLLLSALISAIHIGRRQQATNHDNPDHQATSSHQESSL